MDEDQFPLHPLHPFRLKKAPLSTSLQAFRCSLGIKACMLDCILRLHTDYTSTLDALSRLGKGCAGACIDLNTVSDEELQQLYNAGARGIRLSLHPWCPRSASQFSSTTLGR